MKKYYEINLVNYDDNNVPYNVSTVHCVAIKPINKERATEFCRDELGLDFESVFSINEVPLGEVLEYVDNEAAIPLCLG